MSLRALGATILMIGAVCSAVLALKVWRRESGRAGFLTLRQSFAAVLLLAHEVLAEAAGRSPDA